MQHLDIAVAAAASLLAAVATIVNTWLAVHNRNKIQELAISIDGRMSDLLVAAGRVGEAKGVAQEQQDVRNRGEAP